MKKLKKIGWASYVPTINLFLTLILGVFIAVTLIKTQNSDSQVAAEAQTNIESNEDLLIQCDLEEQLSSTTSNELASNDSDCAVSCSPESSLSLERQVENLQTQLNALAATVYNTGITTVHCEKGCRLPPHLPCGGLNIAVDFLYWQADESGLEYGTKMVGGPLIGEPGTTSTQLLDLHFDWDPGFRVGLGYVFDQFDYWMLSLDWTYIRNKAHGHATAEGVSSQTDVINTIVPTWVNLLDELREGSSNASAHWNVNLNTLDLDLGRSFFLSKQFVLNPYVGFRSGWVYQHYKANYTTVFLDSEAGPIFTQPVTFKAKNKFWGFGPRFGADLIWHFSHHWNLFADVSGNLLYGKFKVNMQNLNDRGIGEGDTPPANLNFTASEHFWRGRLTFDEAIGLGWERFFNCNRYHMSLRVAYELSQWLNQNELYYTFFFRGTDSLFNLPVKSKGNLNFHGIRAGLQFDF